MSEENIKKIVKRYKLLSSFWLFVFLIIAMFANWALIDSNIRNHSELGLEYYSSDTGFIWGAIIFGLNVVLQLLFYIHAGRLRHYAPRACARYWKVRCNDENTYFCRCYGYVLQF